MLTCPFKWSWASCKKKFNLWSSLPPWTDKTIKFLALRAHQIHNFYIMEWAFGVRCTFLISFVLCSHVHSNKVKPPMKNLQLGIKLENILVKWLQKVHNWFCTASFNNSLVMFVVFHFVCKALKELKWMFKLKSHIIQHVSVFKLDILASRLLTR
jgi:hypothetical protein